MSIETVKVPDLGGAESVEVIEIPVAAGDKVAEEDTLVVLESDKASMDVPSPVSGVVKKILVKLGDTVSQDSAIVEVEVESAASEQEPAQAPAESEAAAEEENAGKEQGGKEQAEKAQPEKEKPAKEQPANEQQEKEKSAKEKPAQAKSAESEPAKSAAKASAEKPLTLPDLGTDEAVDVIEVGVAVGDQVAEGDPLMTLEGDKATMDVPSPFAGTIKSLSVKEGDKVKSGQDVGAIEVSGEAEQRDKAEAEEEPPATAKATAEPTPADKDEAAAETPPRTETKPAEEDKEAPLSEPEAPAREVYAGPLVRYLARELGVDLRNVEGSGLKGRIQKEDVRAYVKAALQRTVPGSGSAAAAGGAIPGIPDQDFSRFGDVEEKPLGKVARLTASNMQRVWLNAPMVTQFDDADITDLEAFRKSLKADAEQRGVKLTPVAFLMKACAAVLATNPVLNRSWHSSGEKVIQKGYFHIGMAVDTPRGLLVPVVRDVDKKGVFDIAADIAELAEKAREGKLSSAEMQGGSFSISSLGAIGGRGFTPIVNAPEAAILGVSRASIQPVWNGEEFVPRQLLPLCLTYDHKLVNGADAGRFLTDLVAALADMRRLLL